MPTRIEKLDRESVEVLHNMSASVYLDGECYAFATALHEGLGWPIIGLMNGDEIRHVAVRGPDGIIYDVRGKVSEKEFGKPFGLSFPYELREVTVEELRRSDESDEVRHRSVAMARKMAEVIWPELPWKDSAAQRTRVFCDELEALCRKHHLWIRSPYPAAKPVLAIGEDDEGGYETCLTADGLMFTVDRYFV